MDNAISIFFSKDKTKLLILIFLVIGFVLRLINVLNTPTSVDASGHAIMAINFIEAGKLATWNQSVGLWHFLTDLSYKLFGINDFGARFVALLFGSLTVIIMFLLVKELFGRRTGVIASFLVAVSPFHIMETIPEMDVATMFFALFAMYFLLRALKESRRSFFAVSAILIGLATLIKLYSAFFIPAAVLYTFYYYRKNKLPKGTIVKDIVFFCFIAGIFCLIPVIYNYLLYQDKGITDYNFSGILGIGKEKFDQLYAWAGVYVHDYFNFFFPGRISKIPFFLDYIIQVGKLDIIVMYAGLAGFIMLFFGPKKDYLALFICLFFTLYLYMGSIPHLMLKHYMFLLVLFVPPAAFLVNKITLYKKVYLPLLLVLIMAFQLYWLSHATGGFLEKNPMNQVIAYKNDKMSGSSIVIYDARIFRGIGHFMFAGTHYLESSMFPQVMSLQNNLSGNFISTDIFFVECVTDDCYWGTIKNQPEFNESMEEIVRFFKNNSFKQESFYKDGHEQFRIYQASINLKPATANLIDTTHIFWSNPVGYDEKIAPLFDGYKTHGLNTLIDKAGHTILYSSVIFSFLSIILLFYLFINENEKIEHSNTSI